MHRSAGKEENIHTQFVYIFSQAEKGGTTEEAMKDGRNKGGKEQCKRRHLREAREVTTWVSGGVKERSYRSSEGRG